MNYILRKLRWFIHLFKKREKSDEEPIARESEKKGTPVVEVSRTPGLTCPECGFRIQVTIPMLLSGQPIVCPGCALVLNVEQEKSAGALGALKQLNNAMNQAQQKQKEAMGPMR